jgi:hypothetical protein
VSHATQRLRQVEQVGQQTAYMLQAALQMTQAPREPNPLDPKYDEYNDPSGKQWRNDQYNYQQLSKVYSQAQELSRQLLQQAQGAHAMATEERETLELQRLTRAWPEFSQRETLDKFVNDMGKSYGFSAEELDAVLTDHRQALVARDALAYRAMKAQSGDVKAKVEAKAPKLVRSKQEAKGSPAQARDQKGQFAQNALGRLKQTNSDDDAAAFFTGLVKAGRI